MRIFKMLTLTMAAVGMACSLTPSATGVPPSATATRPAATAVPATATSLPDRPGTPSAEATPPTDVPEAILIESPGVRSRAASPLTVRGQADPTFEQTLVARLFTLDGTDLASSAVTIDAPLGKRGAFEGQLHFTVQSEQQAVLQVLSTSPRDGDITHLASVIMTLVPDRSLQELNPAEPHPEAIVIEAPRPGAQISGGRIVVSGVGLPSFEGTLVVSLLGPDGEVMVEEPLIVEAPDMGAYGSFEITLAYEVAEESPARVVVADPSPAFGGANHVSSVEVRLNP